MHRLVTRSRSRSWTEIAAAILYCARQGQITRTKLMSMVGLSFDQTKYYIADLLAGNLIEPIDEAQRHFRTTEKGHEFLSAYERIQEITPVNRRTLSMINASRQMLDSISKTTL